MEPTPVDRVSALRESKRTSSRRSLKPRQNFSPEPVRKKPVATRYLEEEEQRQQSPSAPLPSTSNFLDQMSRMDQLKQISSIPETEFQLPSWFLEDEDDLFGGGLVDLEEDEVLHGKDYRDHEALLKMEEYSSKFIETNDDDGDDDDEDDVDDLLEEEPEAPTIAQNELIPSTPVSLKTDDDIEEIALLETTGTAIEVEHSGSDEDNKPTPAETSLAPEKTRSSKRKYKQISTLLPGEEQEEEKKPFEVHADTKEEVPSKKKKMTSRKIKQAPIQSPSPQSLASGRPQRNRRQPMQMNDFYCPTFALANVSKPRSVAKTAHTPSPKPISSKAKQVVKPISSRVPKQDIEPKADSPEPEQQEALVENLTKAVSESPCTPEILVSPVSLNEVAVALARSTTNRLVQEVEGEHGASSSSSSSSVQWVENPEKKEEKEAVKTAKKPVEPANDPEPEVTEETEEPKEDKDSVILVDEVPAAPPIKAVAAPKEKTTKPVERLSSTSNVRSTMKINYTKMLKKRGILPQSSIATNFNNKGKKNQPSIPPKKLLKKSKSALPIKLSSNPIKKPILEKVDEAAVLQPPLDLDLNSVTPMHVNEQEEIKDFSQPPTTFATPNTPLSPARSISSTGRPQRHRSTPHSTDYYYPSIHPSAAAGPSTNIKLPALMTSRQPAASNSTTSSTKASPESAQPPAVVQPSAMASPAASDPPPPVFVPKAILSPKRKSTEGGPGVAKNASGQVPKRKTRKEYTRRPGPISRHRPSAPTSIHKPSPCLQLQPKSLAEPLSINISNNPSSVRSSASRQLLSTSSTANNTPVMSPKVQVQQGQMPGTRYPIYGAVESSRDTPLNFFQKMQERRKLNVLAIGLNLSTTYKNKLEDVDDLQETRMYPEEYFYREILLRPSAARMHEIHPPKSPTSEEEQCSKVDVDSLETSQFPQDELISSSPAEACARDVLTAVKSKFAPKEEDSWEENGMDEASDGESDGDIKVLLMHRAHQEPREVQEHLLVMLKYIFVQRLTDISTSNIVAGTSMFYSNSLANANRLRESLRLYSKQRLASILVAHNWLLERLNVYLLASYLNLLRFLKVAGSGLSEHLAKESYKDKHRDFERASEYIKEFLAPKIYDPPTNSLSKIMSCDPLKNVSLVLVYPQITSTNYHPTSVRPYESMFRNLLPRVAQCVEKVDLALSAADLVSIESCTLSCLHVIQKRVREIVKRRPNDHIFLAGWGTSCLLNHKVVATVPGVSGLLDFAFPVDSAAGPRGDVEDDICLTYCPSLFVVGENAADVNFEALQSMRKNMIVDSGLIVVGAANHNLFVSQLRLNIERISQKCVERTIVEHTVDFMKQVMSDLGTQSSKECRDMLKPVVLQNIYEVDMSALRCRPNPPIAGTGVPRPRKNQANSQAGLKQSLVKAFDAKPHNKSSPSSSSSLKSLHVQSISSSSTFHAPQQPSPLSLQSYGPISSSKETGSLSASSHASSSGFGVPSPPARPAPLLSARTSLNSSLKKVSGGDPLRIPTPSMLNQQLPPPMPTTEEPATTDEMQSEQLRREEEQAAAAIMDIM